MWSFDVVWTLIWGVVWGCVTVWSVGFGRR